jgi:hypothetical protein
MGIIDETSRNAMLNAYARGTSYAGNATLYVKLHVGDPGADGTSAPAAHTTRVAITFGSAPSGGTVSNSANVDFADLTANETISWVSLWTASTGGTYRGKDDLATARAVVVGDTLRFSPGSITITLPAA